MKIAIFTDILLDTWGGIPSSIRAQKKGLEKAGHEVMVFCPGFHQPKDDKIIVVPTRRWLKPDGAPLACRPAVVMKFIEAKYPELKDFDIIHVHYEAAVSIVGVKLARKYRIPLVQTMHGREDQALAQNIPRGLQFLVGCMLNFLHKHYLEGDLVVKKDNSLAPTRGRAKMWSLMVRQANQADIVLTPSVHFAKKLKQYGVKPEIQTVSNGIDDAIVQKEWPVRELVPGEKLRLIWNSRVSKEKRILPFLEAVKECRDFVELSVYGGGNELKKAQNFVKKENLETKVKFYGPLPQAELFEKMRGQHLSVMASYQFDTQGMTLLEAEATGLPVFFCDPDMREVVPDYILSKDETSVAMATALRELFQNPKRVREMSEKMLAQRMEVSQSVQLEKLLAIYKRLQRQ